jgi:hypothetical protein
MLVSTQQGGSVSAIPDPYGSGDDERQGEWEDSDDNPGIGGTLGELNGLRVFTD